MLEGRVESERESERARGKREPAQAQHIQPAQAQATPRDPPMSMPRPHGMPRVRARHPDAYVVGEVIACDGGSVSTS